MPPQRDRPAPAEPAEVGRAVRPHGLGGEVVVEASDPGSTYFDADRTLWVAGAWRRVLAARRQHERWIVRFEGVADRDAAEALRGECIAVEAAELPALGADRYYVHDLVGCRVEDVAGGFIGEVVAVIRGPQDWMEVEHERGRSLVPMVRPLMREVDVEEKRVVIDPPDGLVDATRG